MYKRAFRRSFILLIVQVLLIALLLWQFKKPSPLSDSLFRLENSDAIDEVVLTKKTDTVHLIFKNNRWQVNGLKADKQMIKVFFAATVQVQPKRKLSSELSKQISQDVAVSFKEKGTTKLHFTVGKDSTQNTYFFSEQGDAYRMNIPGYQVNLYELFSLLANDWREKRIFDFHWSQFDKAVFQFADAKQNFTLALSQGKILLNNQPADTAKVNTYLDDVSLARLYAYLPAKDTSLYASKKLTPIFTLAVTQSPNKVHTLVVYDWTENKKRLAQLRSEWIWLDESIFKKLIQHPFDKK